MSISKKTKKGSDLTVTGALRKLSYFASASTTMSRHERMQWYWEVIQKAEYDSTSKFDKSIDVEVFIKTILTACEVLNRKEIIKNKGNKNGK